MNLDKQNLSKQCASLKILFETNPMDGISKSQEIILNAAHFQSNADFARYYHEHGTVSSCQSSSSSYIFAVGCYDCSLDSLSYLCLDCFYNGNHQGHKYIIFSDLYGSCDCGNPSSMKCQGFCKHHKGLPDDGQIPNNLNEELTVILTDVVFKAALQSITKYSRSKSQNVRLILNFLTSFIQFGDIFRRLLSISFTEKIDLRALMYNINSYSPSFNQELQAFCGKLVNDELFVQNFSKIGIDLILDKILMRQILVTSDPFQCQNIECWNFFWFQCFTEKAFKFNILQKKWDWVEYIINFSKQLKKQLSIPILDIIDFFPFYKDIIWNFPYASKIQPIEQTQLLFDRLFNEILNCDIKSQEVIPISYRDNDDESHIFKSIYIFNASFYDFFNCFKYKTNLKFDSLFCQLEKLIDISPIYRVLKETKYIQKFLKFEMNNTKYPDYYYGSFHNGGSFFYLNPIYDSLVRLFGLENNCRIKIARFLSLEKYQPLRLKLLIITLKKLLSYTTQLCDLVRKCNFDLYDTMSISSERTSHISTGFPLFLPLFQLLIGLVQMNQKDEFTLKEFTAFEMARFLGIFDNYSKDEYKDEDIKSKVNQMHFAFMYLIILTIVERTLFNYDNYEFISEQLVYCIKNGCTKMSNIQSYCDEKVIDSTKYPLIFNEVLIKIANIQRGNADRNNLFFRPEDTLDIKLKDEVKWKPFSAVIPISHTFLLFNKLVSKNPKDLIEVQEFEPEETYFFNTSLFSRFSLSTCSLEFSCPEEKVDYEGLSIKLKDLVFTPTVLAITYVSMRLNLASVEINDHLSLDILILISKFLKETEIKTDVKFDENVEIHFTSIFDLVSKIKTTIFNQDSEEMIENTLSIENFKKLLKIKFYLSDQQPKSFIDLMHDKGDIGRKALFIIKENLGFDDLDEKAAKKDNENEDEKLKMKKMKANQIKSNIMSSFNKMISDFSLKDDEEEEENGEDDGQSADDCSICLSEKENESVTYPIFIYRTKFPFIVDKPPVAKEGEEIGDAIEAACDDDYQEIDETRGCQVNPEETRDRNQQQQQQQQQEDEAVIEDAILNINYIQQQQQQLQEQEEEEEDVNDDVNNMNHLPPNNHFDPYAELLNENDDLNLDFFEEEEEEEANQLTQEELHEIIKEKRKHLPKRVYEDHVKRYTAGANFVLQFSACHHPLHRSCIKSINYQCPVDTTTKNSFLPCLDNKTTQTNLNENDKQSIELFLRDYKSFIVLSNEQPIDVFVELIKSISGLIVTNEVRLRSLPKCLEAKKNKILARNLFLTTWHAYRMHGKPKMMNKRPYSNSDSTENEDVELRLTEFQKFIKKLIESDDIEINHSSFEKIVSSFLNSMASNESKDGSDSQRKEKEICMFLRRVCLADYFLLNKKVCIDNSNQGLVDWNVILSVKNLSTIYQFNFKTLKENEEFNFKPFLFKQLPDEFLKLSQMPYKLPLNSTSSMKVFDILDFNDLIINYDDLSENYNEIDAKKENQRVIDNAEKFMSNYFYSLELLFGNRNYPTVVLQIGDLASDVLVFCQNRYSFLNSFYLDQNGLPDVGFIRHQPLFLNHDDYIKFTDSILSGEFTCSLHYFSDYL